MQVSTWFILPRARGLRWYKKRRDWTEVCNQLVPWPIIRPHQFNFMFLGSADPSFLRFGKKKKKLIKNCKHVTHHACVNRNIQHRLAKSLSDKEPKKGALASWSHLVRTTIIASFCQGSVFWRSLALSSKLVYIGTANFNDIHNLLIFFFLFLPTYRPYLSLLSVQETWN